MRLSKVAEHIQRISAARDEAAKAVATCVEAIAQAYFASDRAHSAATELDGAQALGGQQATELRELCEHLQVAVEILSEAAFAVAEFHNNRASIQADLNPMARSAREGMHAKRLADWEAEALRTAVVEALAGPKKR